MRSTELLAGAGAVPALLPGGREPPARPAEAASAASPPSPRSFVSPSVLLANKSARVPGRGRLWEPCRPPDPPPPRLSRSFVFREAFSGGSPPLFPPFPPARGRGAGRSSPNGRGAGEEPQNGGGSPLATSPSSRVGLRCPTSAWDQAALFEAAQRRLNALVYMELISRFQTCFQAGLALFRCERRPAPRCRQ